MSSANNKIEFIDDEKRWGYIVSPNMGFYEMSDGLELMAMHLTYHEAIEDPAYVTSGSILACTLGDKYVKVDLTEDYGAVTTLGTPLLTCSDCHENNIHNFGSCLCQESSYDLIPKTPEYRVDKDGNKVMAKKRPGNEFAHICIPLIVDNWKQVNNTTLISINQNIIATNSLRDNIEYSPALLSDAYLVCRLGGYIKIVQVNNEPEIKEPEKIYIAPWLIAFKGEPDRTPHHTVEGKALLPDKRKELMKSNKNSTGVAGVDWYAYMAGVSSYIPDQYDRSNKPHPLVKVVYDKKTDSRITIDGNDRYWIGVGPEVAVPGYNKIKPDKKATLDESHFQLGMEIDVVLHNEADLNEGPVYIQCVLGMIKAHTYSPNYVNGVFQTGIPYPYSSEAKQSGEAHKDGSYIEFLMEAGTPSTHLEDNGKMSQYVVDSIICYDRGW
ncbi:PAAR-like protein [Enterocloster clostridioformis]|nr:PAAR-like protein [uncultured Anaerostipes sp.]